MHAGFSNHKKFEKNFVAMYVVMYIYMLKETSQICRVMVILYVAIASILPRRNHHCLFGLGKAKASTLRGSYNKQIRG